MIFLPFYTVIFSTQAFGTEIEHLRHGVRLSEKTKAYPVPRYPSNGIPIMFVALDNSTVPLSSHSAPPWHWNTAQRQEGLSHIAPQPIHTYAQHNGATFSCTHLRDRKLGWRIAFDHVTSRLRFILSVFFCFFSFCFWWAGPKESPLGSGSVRTAFEREAGAGSILGWKGGYSMGPCMDGFGWMDGFAFVGLAWLLFLSFLLWLWRIRDSVGASLLIN